MYNVSSLKKIAQARLSPNIVKPCYDSYCFAHLPATIQYLLTGEGEIPYPVEAFTNLETRYKQVIVLFVDGFGWRFFKQVADNYHILRAAVADGVVSQQTSQFPSTTAAHVTTIHTGLPIGQSGVFEWAYYEPLVDNLIVPLPFSLSLNGFHRDSLISDGIEPAQILPETRLYPSLQRHGVRSHVIQPSLFTPGSYTNHVTKGAILHPYEDFSQACADLTSLLLAERHERGYYYLYTSTIDTIGHLYGPSSPEFRKAIDDCFTLLDQTLAQLRGKLPDALCMVIADHGQVDVHPESTIYLDKLLPGFERFLRTNRAGRLLVPAGSPRDMFLYIKEECEQEALEILQEKLKGKASVRRTSELLAEGFWGEQAIAPEFAARLSNLVVLPEDEECVWWYDAKRPMPFFGHHGGLHPFEMETPLILLPLA